MATKWKWNPESEPLTRTLYYTACLGSKDDLRGDASQLLRWHWPVSCSHPPLGILSSSTCPYKRPTSTVTSVCLKSTFTPSGHEPCSLFLLTVPPSSLSPGLELRNCFPSFPSSSLFPGHVERAHWDSPSECLLHLRLTPWLSSQLALIILLPQPYWSLFSSSLSSNWELLKLCCPPKSVQD